METAIELDSLCMSCGATGVTRNLLTRVAHFNECLLMAFTCDECGFKNSELKPLGRIAPRGKRIVLRVEDGEDLTRDLVRSDTAKVVIPEIEFEVQSGSNGKFTTIEGFLRDVRKDIAKVFGEHSNHIATFLQKLDRMLCGAEAFTFILDDPLAQSYLQNLHAPHKDPQMTIEEYDRTAEQNEELGIADMCAYDDGAE